MRTYIDSLYVYYTFKTMSAVLYMDQIQQAVRRFITTLQITLLGKNKRIIQNDHPF